MHGHQQTAETVIPCEELTAKSLERTSGDHLGRDGANSIRRRSGDCAKESTATARNFEFDSNRIDRSDVRLEKLFLQRISTDAGT
jgi:hypothetical protein